MILFFFLVFIVIGFFVGYWKLLKFLAEAFFFIVAIIIAIEFLRFIGFSFAFGLESWLSDFFGSFMKSIVH